MCTLTLSVLTRAIERPIQRPIAHPIPAPPLSQVINNSGYIFQGTVTQVQWLPPRNPQDVATVQITFRVVQGIRGVRQGQTFSIREWAGLWDSNDRYQIGQNVVLFLYRPSKLGLTSPVSGPMGKFLVGTGSLIDISPTQRILLSTDPAFGTTLHDQAVVRSRDFTNTLRQIVGREQVVGPEK
ncbi:MAG TPA: hypothetical protein VGF44_15980 [Terriglobales bacterium]|jgi:hypothetical protein